MTDDEKQACDMVERMLRELDVKTAELGFYLLRNHVALRCRGIPAMLDKCGDSLADAIERARAARGKP